MKKTQLLALILGGMLIAQNTAVLAAGRAGVYGMGSTAKLYAAAVKEPTHKEKKELLVSKNILTDKFVKDEKKKVTYADASNLILLLFEIYPSGNIPKDWKTENSEDFYLKSLIAHGIITEKDKIDFKSEIKLSTMAEWCMKTIGYQYESDLNKKAIEYGIISSKDKGTDTVTVEKLIDMIYATINTPICVIDGWESVATKDGVTAIPLLIVLDGGKKEDGSKKDLVTLLLGIEEYEKELAQEKNATPAPTSAPSKTGGSAGSSSSDTTPVANGSAGSSSSQTAVIKKGTAQTTAEKIADLQKYGIIAKTDDLRLNDKISRAEIAKILTTMKGVSYPDRFGDLKVVQSFTDVPADHWAHAYIEFMRHQGILEGDQGLFRPNANVTYAEFCKMLVSLLGYETYADNQGGYPNGYLMQATKLGLGEGLDGISTDAELTREQIMLMAYNAMDIPIVVIDSWENVQTADGVVVTPVLVILDGTDDKDFASIRTFYFETE